MEWMIEFTMRIKIINIDNPKFESVTNRKVLRVAESVLMRFSYKCDWNYQRHCWTFLYKKSANALMHDICLWLVNGSKSEPVYAWHSNNIVFLWRNISKCTFKMEWINLPQVLYFVWFLTPSILARIASWSPKYLPLKGAIAPSLGMTFKSSSNS